MQKMFAHLRMQVSAFVEQRDDLLMLVKCSDCDAAIALRLLRQLDGESDCDVFVLFSHSFVDIPSYVEQLVDFLAEQCASARIGTLPATIQDRARPSLTRLQEALAFLAGLMPENGGNRVVVGMLPADILAVEAWSDMLASLLPRSEVAWWMRYVRLIARYPSMTLERSAPNLPRTRLLELDLSPSQIEASMQLAMANETISIEQRMQALLALAGLDFARGRFTDSAAKYQHLLGHYQHTNNLSMQALAMHGIGELHQRTGNQSEALRWYECAAVPAAQGELTIVFRIVIQSLARMYLESGRSFEAAELFEGLSAISAKQLDPESTVYAMERAGVCRATADDLPKAMLHWQSAAALCRSLGLTEMLRTVLSELHKGFCDAQMTAQATAVFEELKGLDASEDSNHE